ncbi:4-carboxymuconolactone decarboxylase [Mycobacterium sp. MS1601]|uniref:carboxymuconolactone decarboxylase family protein n=1 Tax=Mycobacterium sp. MS1601 TaxID=1936029 RepID=UPI0009794FB9|nr:carboxymuconolactone decarboxylase family protein [Mycobacterium sp. MS1601]AQA01651.1 4-carboxymuconolactone decarboxylase [Mycobacterium sp. MS1601]
MTSEGSHEASYQRGISIRKAVLGEAHVQKSLDAVSDFSRPIQELVSEYCWGEVWSREGIDRKTRSMLNLAMLTALNRGHELGVHVRGAINNGVTPAQIQEVLIQSAIYVGVPAALESFRVAERVLKEMDIDV